ncbi:hypothetical protein [Bradyrhizobium sp. CCBAU 11430]|uniref:hypothetical protein n=1 Tax=Bradyrhizobium sp. CCBAU 11430 TaxID=1630881 RepID=UPI003FA435D4
MTTAYDAVTAASPTQRAVSFSSLIVSAMSARDAHDTLPASVAMMNHHLAAASRTRSRALVWLTCRFSAFISVSTRQHALPEVFYSGVAEP